MNQPGDWPTHPQVRAFAQELDAIPADPGTVAACVDWLQDAGATLADMVYLFALPPDRWGVPVVEDLLFKPVLSEWCRATGEEDIPRAGGPRSELIAVEVVHSNRQFNLADTLVSIVDYWPRHAMLYFQWEEALGVLEMQAGTQARLFGLTVKTYQRDAIGTALRKYLSDQRRAVKRKVLALFPDLKYKVKACVGNLTWKEWTPTQRGSFLAGRGFCLDNTLGHLVVNEFDAKERLWTFSQVLPAVDLVPAT